MSRPRAGVAAAMLLAAACGGERGGSPTCGMALLIGPSAIAQRMTVPRALIATPPRGLVDTLPARVAGEAMGAVLVRYDGERIAMTFQGPRFPAQPGYAVLVVDDTSQRAVGVLVYNREGPQDYPALGSVSAGGLTVPLYGVLVDWASVSNPRCPLLGPAPVAPPPGS